MNYQKIIDSGNWDIFKTRTCNWRYISSKLKLPESFIREFSDKVIWDNVIFCQNVPIDLIDKYIKDNNLRYEDRDTEMNKVSIWRFITKHQKLDEEFIINNEDSIKRFSCWHCIFRFQENISEELINNFIGRALGHIEYRKDLSINIIEKFKDMLNWDTISQYHILSDKFCNKFKDSLRPSLICNKNLTKDIFNDFKYLFNKKTIGYGSPYLSEDILDIIRSEEINWQEVIIRDDISEEFLVKKRRYIDYKYYPIDKDVTYSKDFFIKMHYKLHFLFSFLDKKYNKKLIKDYWPIIKSIRFNFIFSEIKNFYIEDLIRIHHKIDWFSAHLYGTTIRKLIKYRRIVGINNIMNDDYIDKKIKKKIRRLEEIY